MKSIADIQTQIKIHQQDIETEVNRIHAQLMEAIAAAREVIPSYKSPLDVELIRGSVSRDLIPRIFAALSDNAAGRIGVSTLRKKLELKHDKGIYDAIKKDPVHNGYRIKRLTLDSDNWGTYIKTKV